MKSFLKTYWLEFLFFAVGFVGVAVALPFLPDQVPIQWHGGVEISAWASKWYLLLLTAVQLPAAVVTHYGMQRYFHRFPALEPALSGFERLLPVFLSVVILTCQLCSMLAAWGVAVNIAVVLLIELLLVPIVFIGFVAGKILGSIGKPK